MLKYSQPIPNRTILSRRSRTQIRRRTLRDSETVFANKQKLFLNQSSVKIESTSSRLLPIHRSASTRQPLVSTKKPAECENRVARQLLLTMRTLRLSYCNSALGPPDLQPASFRAVPHGSRWMRGGFVKVHASLRVGGSPPPYSAAAGTGLTDHATAHIIKLAIHNSIFIIVDGEKQRTRSGWMQLTR